jgi:hypothetical protein
MFKKRALNSTQAGDLVYFTLWLKRVKRMGGRVMGPRG